MFLVIVVNNKK